MAIKRNSQPGSWVIDTFRDMGVDIRVLLRALPDETTCLLKNPESIAADQLNAILLACAEQTNDRHFGLHLGEVIELSNLGIYGYLLLNAGTIGEFLSLAERYYTIFYRGANVEIIRRPTSWRLVYRRTVATIADQRHDDEWTLGTFVNTIRSKVGSRWNPLHTSFQFASPEHPEELERIFGHSLSFNQPLNSFDVDSTLLDLPLNNSDPRLLQIIRDQADELMTSYKETESIEAQLRLLIMKDLEFGSPKAENIALQMGMSLSTFKRLLSRHNLGFRALRDAVIRELATRALTETDVQISEVAMQLGYSEASAFNHAFLRLVGKSPRDYRRWAAST